MAVTFADIHLDHGAHLVETLQSLFRLPVGDLRDGLAVFPIDLPFNIPQLNNAEGALPLQDAQGVTRLNSGVLSGIAAQNQTATVLPGELQESNHLPRGEQACFVDDKE